MNRRNLRKKTRISYYEPDEPKFDEYIYCEECSDFVYEYCAIHGPLLVIPDEKVPAQSPYPAYVPRAALTIPNVFLHLAPSIIPGAGLGVFSTLTLPRGVRFGPYSGDRTQNVDSMYCWQIFDSNNKRSHVIDAADGNHSNWMRYVNCARHWQEQNLVAYQYQGQLYYRTIKIIPRFTELLVFYGSEFANVLNIDLREYNKKEYYQQVISKSQVLKRNITEIPSEYLDDKIEDDYIEINEDITEAKEDYRNINNTNDNNSTENNDPIEVKYNGDEITINFNVVIKNNEFKCDVCNKVFANKRNLKLHIQRHLRKYTYNCQLCNFKTNLKLNFDEHLERHTKDFKYSCEFCFYKTDTRRYFLRHCNEVHKKRSVPNNNAFICDACNKLFKIKRSLRAHIQRHLKKYICQICDFKTNLKLNFEQHLNNHAKSFKYSCELCFYKTDTKKYFTSHCNNHKICVQIGNIKKTERKISRDIRKTPKSCDLCDFKTNSYSNYKRHMHKHKGNRFKCDFCDYKTYIQYNLTRHIRNMHKK